MANCTSCGAPLQGSSTLCHYCGARNNFDLKGVGEYRVVSPNSKRFCPCCSEQELETIDVGGEGKAPFFIERCPSCGGLFFDLGELEAILENSVTHGSSINRDRLRQIVGEASQETFEVVYRRCPVCSEMMQRKSYGAQSRVIIDRCAKHGIWLDAGELRRLMEWKSAGGEQLNEKMQAHQKKYVDGRAKEHKSSMARDYSGSSYGYSHSSGGDSLTGLIDAFVNLF